MLCCCGGGKRQPPGKAGELRVDTAPPPEADPTETEDGGLTEPPATPVGRDELALKRHRFFSDLMAVAETQGEHRVRFDPRGPSFSGESEQYRSCRDLEGLISRLEVVTSRLETTLAGLDQIVSSPLDNLPDSPRLLIPDAYGCESSSLSPGGSPEAARISMAVAGFREIVAGPLASYLQLSDKLGGHVAQQAQLVKQAFSAQLEYIEAASSRAEPGQNELTTLLGPTSQGIQSVQGIREQNRASPVFNHLSAVSESIPALGWVTVKPAPSPFVKEMSDAGQFYTNRVLKEYKEKDKTHVEWVKAWLETLSEMQRYVKQHHTTGLVWGGGSAAGAPPPPPGPPPPPLLDLSASPLVDDGRSALFAQINQGENITKGLKKVTSEMQTHKNTSLRTGPAPFKASVHGGGSTGSATAQPVEKPPVFNRDGKKWLIEHHKGRQDLVVEGAEMNNVVYVYNCHNSTVTIKGKINSVFVDSCKKTNVLFDTLVSSIEFVNCNSVQMQVMGKVPTVSVDKTNSCQIFLNKESLAAEIFTSACTAINVCKPKPNGDYGEYPIPDQFKTVITDNGIETTTVENKG